MSRADARKAGIMQTQRNVKQWVFKKCFMLFCVFLLFLCGGLVLLLTSTTYARSAAQNTYGSNVIRPADTLPTSVPTIPTTAPTIVPTITPPIPTATPIHMPTVTPTAPKTKPTPPPPPTATTIAGVLPPAGNVPTPQATVSSAPSPTATAKKTATPDALSPTPAATNTISSSVTNSNKTSTASRQSAANAISLPQIASIVGAVVILSSVLFMGLVWRQRRMQLRAGPVNSQQRARLYPLPGRAVTEPLYQAPQPLVPQAVPEMALVASNSSDSLVQYAQAPQEDTHQSLLREQSLLYQAASPSPMGTMQGAAMSSQASTPTSNQLLESMMRQAQMGLFALPDKTD